MKLINDGLPEPVYLAIKNDKYDAGDCDYTPSSLITPPYQAQLIRENKDQIVEYASDRVWALMGTCVHYMIERAAENRRKFVTETRYAGHVDISGHQYKVGAQVDLLDTTDCHIYDMKVTSAYQYGKEPKPEWVQQLNIQRWCIFKSMGVEVKSLNIIGIWRDWSKNKALSSGYGYPPHQVTQVPVPVWSFEATESYISDRIILHEEAKLKGSGQISPCTPVERWEEPDRYAVVKKGNKRATKLCDTHEDAVSYIGVKKGFDIQIRKGDRKRCSGYCPVSKFCPDYQSYLKDQ